MPRVLPVVRPSALLLALLALLVALLTAASARADQAPVLGAAPVRDATYNFVSTRLGADALSTHLLHVGQRVTETISIDGSPETGGAYDFGWVIPDGFEKVSDCVDGSYDDQTHVWTGTRRCVMQAIEPTLTAASPIDCGTTIQYLGYGCFHNWTVDDFVYLDNIQGRGVTQDYYAILPNDYKIAGAIVDESGHPEVGAAPITLRLTPSIGSAHTATTDNQAAYSAILTQDDAVKVTPPAGYVAYRCPGMATPDGSCVIRLDHDYDDVDFQARGFALNGTVTDATGRPAAGTTVAIQGPQPTTATTDAQGHFSATDLPNGTYSVTPQPKGTAFPVASTDCTVSELSCQVTLNQTRNVKFVGCVQPDPSGKPLPADTPDPIPGAVSTGTLEAVGCFTPPADGGTRYTTTKPVRLDGLDVVPAGGTTITVDKTASSVTSDGPATLQIAGYPIATPAQLNMSYVGNPTTGALSGATGSQPFPNLFGLPFTFNVNGPEALPWATTPGTTSMQLGIGVPYKLLGEWSAKLGKFLPAGSLQNATVGVNGTFTLTNRGGLQTPKLCGSVGRVTPWPDPEYEIGKLELCYDAAAGTAAGFGGIAGGQWTGTGELALPASTEVEGLAKPTVTVSVGLLGTQLNQGSIGVSNLNKHLDDGVFLQSIEGSFSRDLQRGVASSITGTAGLSFGPSVAGGVQILSLKGALTLQMFSTPALYKLTGNLSFLAGTPIASTISSGFVSFIPGTASTGSKLDFGGNLQLTLPRAASALLGRANVSVNVGGFYDAQKAAVQFTGSGSLDLPGLGHTTVSVVSNDNLLGLCDEHDGYSVGFTIDYGTFKPNFYAGTCDISRFSLTQTPTTFRPSAQTSAAKGGSKRFAIPAGLAGTTIAVQGKGAPPKVALSGGGRTVSATGSGTIAKPGSLVYRDPATDTTFLVLYKPKAGTYALKTLSGSTAITAVKRSAPAAHPQLAGSVVQTGCTPTLHYAYAPAAGRTVALYAVDALQRRLLGTITRKSGTLSVPTGGANIGAGEVEADELAGGLVQSTTVLGRYDTTSPGPPGAVALAKGRLSWAAGCGEARYTVKLAPAKGKATTVTTTATAIALPKGLKGRVAVTVTALDAAGAAHGTATAQVTA